MYIKVLFFILLCTSLFATENVTIDVYVLDENNAPMISAIAYSDDYAISGYTDENGMVTLKNVKHTDYINFSYVGYTTLRLQVREIHNLKYHVKLSPEPKILNQIVVIGRKDIPIEDILFETQFIKSDKIDFLNIENAADVLTQTGSVFIQKTQLGGGSPVIRGFEANKVLLVLDGVRLNNAIYRNGHLQNAITIDNNILERAEVIFGPGSINYGSDALGGVVHYRTKDPTYKSNNNKKALINSDLGFTYSSANQGKKVHFDVNYGLKKFASLTSVTYVDYNDLRSGRNRPDKYPEFGKQYFYVQRLENQDLFFPNENPDIQAGTGYSQIDILQKIKTNISKDKYIVANIQYSTSSNVPRYDKLTDTISQANDFKYAEYYYGPQRRFLSSLKLRTLEKKSYFDNATYILAYQNITEDRYFRKFGNARRFFNIEKVHVASFTADFLKNLTEDNSKNIEYGLDLNYNKVLSEAGKFHIASDVIDRSHLTRYPSGGASMTMLGTYATYKQKLGTKNNTLHAGLRYTYTGLRAKYLTSDLIEWPEFYYDGINLNNSAITGMIGLKLKKENGLIIDAVVGTAFRSPNIDDFGKIREKNGFVTIPNPTLKPEKSINGELSMNYNFGSDKSSNIGATFFYTYLYDAIIREKFYLPNGDSILTYANEPRIIQSNVNADRAFIYGTSIHTDMSLSKSLQLKANINYTYGRKYVQDTTLLLPLSHIPPLYGKLELAYKKKNFKLATSVLFNGAKTLENYGGSEDNLEEATIDGTPSWQTFNFYAQFNLTSTLKLNLAFENILDVHYRPFASGISAPGRNFIIALKKHW